MIVVGDVLRMPAAINFADTDSAVRRGLTRSTSRATLPTKGSRARSRNRGISFPVTVRKRP